jgi:serine/threonine-protein kinase
MIINTKLEGRYLIKSVLGEGGMAVVYLADDIFTSRRVAIKMIKDEMAQDPLNIARFEREAKAAAELLHPNIVQILNVGEYNDKPYIVMEYVKSNSLRDILQRRGSFPYEEASDIMLQLTNGIYTAHQHGVIHRDLKPQNVLMQPDGTAKISDFGIATFQNAPQITQHDMVMGSVHYMSPEVAQGYPATVQSDIYALGITYFELLSGRVPFEDSTPVAVALHQIKDPLPSIRKLVPSVPLDMEKIIEKACAKKNEDRYKTAYEMHEAIMNCLLANRRTKPKTIWAKLKERFTKKEK